MDATEQELVKASLTRLDSLETVPLLWNPARYRIRRRNELSSAPVLGARTSGALIHGGGEQCFQTRLFVDTSENPLGPERDARRLVAKLAGWMAPETASACPVRVVFVWGPFRFSGAIQELEEEWLRFDPDGTPTRAWISLRLIG